VRIAAPAVVLVGTLSRTAQSFSSTSRRNTLGRRNQRRGHGAGLSGLAMSGLAISAPPQNDIFENENTGDNDTCLKFLYSTQYYCLAMHVSTKVNFSPCILMRVHVVYTMLLI